MTKSRWRMTVASRDVLSGLAKAQDSLASLEDWVISCSDLANVEMAAPPPGPPRQLLGVVAERWAVSATDPNVRNICDRLETACTGVPAGFINVLLQVAERVAQAEAAKDAWDPKLKKKQLLGMARDVVYATQLLNDLKRKYPLDWATQEFAASLAGFIRGAINGGLLRVNVSQ